MPFDIGEIRLMVGRLRSCGAEIGSSLRPSAFLTWSSTIPRSDSRALRVSWKVCQLTTGKDLSER